jgi:DNA-binding SARP family transcriptional activator
VAGSLATALLVFAATPTVLLTLVGNPLAGGLGHQWSEEGRAVLAGLVVVAWVAWGACCLQLTRSVVRQVRRGHVGSSAGAGLGDRVAARIAAGVLSLAALTAPVALTSGAGATGDGGGSAVAQANAPAVNPPAVASTLSTAATASTLSTAATTYVVRPGDSLWSIAAAQLGDGDDWPAIAALNLGRAMPDGMRFVDPNRIYAGWSLQMPGLRTPVAEVTMVVPAHPAAPLRAPTPEGLPVGVPERPLVPVSLHPTASEPAARPVTREGAGPGYANLPELAVLGIGAIGCAALARRSRRMRLLRQMSADEPEVAPALSARAIDTDVLLGRFAGVPALRAFEAANCRLAQALAGEPRPAGAPGIRTICVGAAGVDFWLAEPGLPAPVGFTLSPDGHAWHCAHDARSSPDLARPFLPISLPVGEDDAGTWFVPLQRGSVLPLVGPEARALWCAARPVQEAWSWADMVLITEDPGTVASEVRLQGDSHGSPDDAPILFFGDPASLTPALAEKVSVVTLSYTPASDVTVLVDRLGASIHPLGRTVRPHLMYDDTADAVDELVSPAPRPLLARERRVADAPPATWPTGPGVPSPGIVEVKLLTTTPRLEGLSAALPPNRARRAVELVAYLALHGEDGVTSDRLRTRVLGSSDADAASKTLFNIATAARRAMGTDAAGLPLLPPGTRTGHYRVAGEVTVDVHRAAALAAAGGAAEDPEEAMALLRAALGLIDGEPMANALSGYTWWESEGHGARIAAVLVNAAGNLAALAVDADLFELAQWGLGQARLVDPYSEAISRAAMQVAAAAGDADRLRREWRECQRRMDELDPGSTPSPRTERLYGELARRVLVGANRAGDQ